MVLRKGHPLPGPRGGPLCQLSQFRSDDECVEVAPRENGKLALTAGRQKGPLGSRALH